MPVPIARHLVPCLLGAALATACSEGSGPTSAAQASLSFTAGTGAKAAAMSLSAAPVSVGGKTLVLSQVQVVLSEVELKAAEHTGTCAGEGGGCEEFEAGPTLIDLPVDGGVTTAVSTSVAAGTYSEAELKVDVPDEDNAATVAFLAAHPAWPASASIHVVGTFDANDGLGPQPFDRYLAGEAELELEFNPPVTVESAGAFNVTVAIDPSRWFLAGDGSLIDPAALAADAELQGQVMDNVDASFHVFEDDNKDGTDD